MIRQSIGIRDNRCLICNTPILWREAISRKTCSDWKCITTYRKMQLDRRYRRRLARATKLRNASAPTLGVHAPESYRVIITPVNERTIVPLSGKRRYRFVKRLIRLVKSTLQDAQLDPRSLEGNQQSLPILGTACANCEGKCCVRGGTGAHLDSDAISRFANIHPDAEFRDIVEAYHRSLPFTVYRDSCVFHSADGCSLPRYMRSATCLNTVCGGVVELRQRIELDGESRFFLAAVNKNGAVRGKLEDC